MMGQDNDLSFSVKKKPIITIEPDSMYFYSHTPRKFKIRNIPAGYIIKGDFMGYNFYVQGGSFTLKPWFVYRDSDVLKSGVGLMNGENSTSEEFYITQVHFKIFDDHGIQVDSIVRNCYIRPEPFHADYRVESVGTGILSIDTMARKKKVRKLKQ